MELNYVIRVDLSKELVALLNRGGAEAERSNIVGKSFAGKVAVNGSKFI